MLDANAQCCELDTITFAIGSGHQVIQPLTTLPYVSGWLMIDGTTQPGYAGSPLIELDGSLASGNGLSFQRGGVRALVINNFSGVGVEMYGASSVRGCYIGTDHTGTQARPNGHGVQIWSNTSDATPSRIGGAHPNDRNLVSANQGTGVTVYDNAIVDGNRFGTNAAGTAILGSQTHHLYLGTYDGSSYEVGVNKENYFAGGQTGIYLSFAKNSLITNNQIGVSHSGAKLPVHNGIVAYQSSDSVITKNAVHASNSGVSLYGSTLRMHIRENAITGPGFGIDFGQDGHTPNDAGDFDTGSNNRINHPDISKATSLDGVTTITGTYSGYANRSFTIDFYRSSACHHSGYGPGGAWLGSTGVTTDGSGNASFNHAIAVEVPAGEVITATATSNLEGTSEFSACRIAEGRGALAFASMGFVTGTEGSTLNVIVARTAGSAGTVGVTWGAVAGGTATAGSDYTPAGGTLTFGDGETSKTLTLTFTDDSVFEGQEQIQLALTNPTGGASLGATRKLTVGIHDNDPPPFLILPDSPLRVAEGNSGTKTVAVPVALSHAVGVPITVRYVTWGYYATPPEDYVHVDSTFTFAPGETQKTIHLTINGDTTLESNEYFYLNLSSASLGSRSLQVVIENDEARPKISVGDKRVVETDGTHVIEVPITATANITGTVAFSFPGLSATYGVDYDNIEYYLDFNNEKSKTVRVKIFGDDETEPNETFNVEIYYVSAFAEVDKGTGRVTIVNDDTGVGPSEQTIPLGGGGPIVIDIGEPLDHPVTILLSSSDPATVSVPAEVVLEAGQSSIIVDAQALKAPGTALITVTMPAELEGDVFTLRVRTYTPANLVFDPDPLVLFNGQTRTVKVKLEPAATEPMTFALTGSDTVLVPKTVTIPPGDAGTFTVEAKKVGPIFISTRLPRAYGDREVILHGQVRETPATPTILKVSPPDGPSAGGTTVELEGANFVRDCALTFGGTPATSLQFITAELMSAVTPAHDAGTVDVVLTCGDQTSNFGNGFTFTDSAPQLSHVAPSTGNVAGGTHVRIGGTALRSSCWPFFDGVPAPSASLESPSSMLALTPPQAAGAADVLLECTGGEASLADAFFYTEAEEPAPSITTVMPLAAAPGEEVTVLGTRFRPTDKVAFTMPFATIVRTAPDSHVVIVPETNAQRYSIDVIDVSGRATTTGPIFTVLEATRPRVTSIVPQSAPAGAEIELLGEGFRPGYTFTIANRPATIVQSSYTRAIVRLANGIVPGQYEVNVINAGGNTASIGPKVNVTADGLSITAVSKNCATTSGGGTMTITGTGFEGALLVTLGAAPASNVTIVNETTLTVTIPPAEAGPAQIRIVNGDGEAATFTGAFRYTSPFDPNGCTTVVTPSTKGRAVRH